jgi:hypothetical protein
MPFTLAHPAAVMPLKRFCPRFLSLGGLVVGSMAPDAGYAFHKDIFSHSWKGSVGFSLPAGLVMLGLFYAVRRPVTKLLPERHRRVFLPVCDAPLPPIWGIVISILIGAWTHLLWDSFTHAHGWAVMRFPLLRTPVMMVAGHGLLVCYVCSFGGVAWLYYAYLEWRQKVDPAAAASGWMSLRNAFLVGLLVVPVEILHHLVRSTTAFALVGVCSLAVVIGAAVLIENSPAARPENKS